MSRPPCLTREQALAIRDAYTAGTTRIALAARYGVSASLISLVVNGRQSTVQGLPRLPRQPQRTRCRMAPPPCGTRRGYEWHRRYGVPIDQACRSAASAAKKLAKQRAALRRRCERAAHAAALEAVTLGHPGGFEALYEAALAEELAMAGGTR